MGGGRGQRGGGYCRRGEVVAAEEVPGGGTADAAEDAGAVVLRLPRLGKGQALSAAERAAPPGRLLLCDAELEGDLAALLNGGGGLVVAALPERPGGGFGGAQGPAPALRCLPARSGPRQPLSG